jgi:hypothetical protein
MSGGRKNNQLASFDILLENTPIKTGPAPISPGKLRKRPVYPIALYNNRNESKYLTI